MRATLSKDLLGVVHPAATYRHVQTSILGGIGVEAPLDPEPALLIFGDVEPAAAVEAVTQAVTEAVREMRIEKQPPGR
jgi:hypothetical protein